jgi:hypothetical protein
MKLTIDIPQFINNHKVRKTHVEEVVLPGYSYFRELTSGDTPVVDMGKFGYLKSSRPEFNAFVRRLRVGLVVKSSFEGMMRETQEGYDALNRHFLIFSAFERYCIDCLGIQPFEYERFFRDKENGDFLKLLDYLKKVPSNDALWQWFKDNCSNQHQWSNLLGFKNGLAPHNGIYLSVLVRHVFAHGVLSANLSKVETGTVARVANHLSELLYKALVHDFWHRLEVQHQLLKSTNS